MGRGNAHDASQWGEVDRFSRRALVQDGPVEDLAVDAEGRGRPAPRRDVGDVDASRELVRFGEGPLARLASVHTQAMGMGRGGSAGGVGPVRQTHLAGGGYDIAAAAGEEELGFEGCRDLGDATGAFHHRYWRDRVVRTPLRIQRQRVLDAEGACDLRERVRCADVAGRRRPVDGQVYERLPLQATVEPWPSCDGFGGWEGRGHCVPTVKLLSLAGAGTGRRRGRRDARLRAGVRCTHRP